MSKFIELYFTVGNNLYYFEEKSNKILKIAIKLMQFKGGNF